MFRIFNAILCLIAIMAAAQVQAEGDATSGEALFGRCSACHAAQEDKIGPHLGGLVGRKAGSVTGYRYSSAMAASRIVWDDENLGQFLASPSAFVKGTKMSVSVPKPSDRADIIAYLNTLSSQ